MSATIQDYLKAIYKLQSAGQRVSTSALAERMGVTAPSATSMVSRLAEQGLLRHDRYRGVGLTEQGERSALEVIRHHRLWESFLSETLNVPLDQLHAEAERLEHALSEDLEERIDALLGHPTHDPHGDPIPSKSGEIVPDENLVLSALPAETAAVVRRVPDSDPALLRYLTSLAVIPERPIRMVERAPFGGTLIVETEAGRFPMGEDLARRIRVEPEDRPEPSEGGHHATPALR